MTVILLSCAAASSAIEYHLTASNGTAATPQLKMTASNPSAGTYVLKFEPEFTLTNIYVGTYIHTYNPGATNEVNVQLAVNGTYITYSKVGNVATSTIISAGKPPVPYGNLQLLVPAGSVTGVSVDLVFYTWPASIDWTTSTTVDDTTLPYSVTAALASKTHNSAVINVSAEDDITETVTKFVVSINGGTEQTLTASSNGQITLNNLSPATNYSVVVKAKDNANNVSTEYATVTFTTDAPPAVTTAASHCHTSLAMNNNKTIYLTCLNPYVGIYQIKIEADENITGLGDSYCYQNGAAGYRLNTAGHFTLVDSRTIICDISSSSPPNLYTPLYVKFANGGQCQANWPATITWGVCAAQEEDGVKPEMISAELLSTTFNSAVITVSAEDDITDPVTKFVVSINGGTEQTLTASNGQITLNNLSPATDYSVVVKAKDNAGNVSDNEVTVTFTTASFQSQCSGDKGHFSGNPAKIHYEILYTSGQVICTVTSLNAADPLDVFDCHFVANGASLYFTGTITNGVGTYALTTATHNITEGTIIGVRFVYSLQSMGGNEQTSDAMTLTDPNMILYKTGQCSLQDDEDPVMTSATFLSATFNSAVITVSAEDNITAPVTKFVVSINGAEQTLTALDGKITLNNLLPSTNYSVDIKAQDAAGNISENSMNVEFTTEAAPAVPEDVLIDDFEDGNKGWAAAFEGAANSIIENPELDLINPSAHVLTSSRAAGTNDWGGAYLDYTNSFQTTKYNYVHILMYRDNTSVPNLKVSNNTPSSNQDIKPMCNVVAAGIWQDVVFDISAAEYIDFIFVMIDRTLASGTATMYIDDIILSNSPVPRIDTVKPHMLSATHNEASTTNTAIALNVSASDIVSVIDDDCFPTSEVTKFLVEYSVVSGETEEGEGEGGEEEGEEENAPQRISSAVSENGEYTAVDGVITING
ncbi:MAG: fibronectin type III domain-containing protein [Prevotellaceae bacterium]|nr:fibronectin type III domain-containing protein [Prevotellaceae bacterium]